MKSKNSLLMALIICLSVAFLSSACANSNNDAASTNTLEPSVVEEMIESRIAGIRQEIAALKGQPSADFFDQELALALAVQKSDDLVIRAHYAYGQLIFINLSNNAKYSTLISKNIEVPKDIQEKYDQFIESKEVFDEYIKTLSD